MIRLFITFVVCLALQPARAADAFGGTAIIAAAHGDSSALPSNNVQLGPATPTIVVCDAPAWTAAGDAAAPLAHVSTSRLWLRDVRLLC